MSAYNPNINLEQEEAQNIGKYQPTTPSSCFFFGRERLVIVEKVNAEERIQTVKTKSTIWYCPKTQHFVCGRRHYCP